MEKNDRPISFGFRMIVLVDNPREKKQKKTYTTKSVPDLCFENKFLSIIERTAPYELRRL